MWVTHRLCIRAVRFTNDDTEYEQTKMVGTCIVFAHRTAASLCTVLPLRHR